MSLFILMVKLKRMFKVILITFLTFLSAELLGQNLESIALKDAGSGSQYELRSLKNSKAAVLIFFGNRCAYNTYYVDRLKNLVREFEPEGIRFLLVNSNSSKVIVEESVENMRRYLQNHQLNLPYLADTEQVLKKAMGATRSPEVYLLQSKGGDFEVIYSGAIDDSPPSEGDVSHPYLRRAILSLLQNEKPATSRVRPAGCLIR